MKLALILPVVFSFLLLGCTSYTDVQIASSSPTMAPTSTIQSATASQIATSMATSIVSPAVEAKSFTIADIALHATKDDCWLAIHGKVYDVSNYTKHPGGEAILEGCGKDATVFFETRPMGSGTAHSEKARSFLPYWYIGELAA